MIAITNIVIVVVLPLPRRPALTNHTGLSGNKRRSINVSASPINTHLSLYPHATSHSHSSVKNFMAFATAFSSQFSRFGIIAISSLGISNNIPRNRSKPGPGSRTRYMLAHATARDRRPI